MTGTRLLCLSNPMGLGHINRDLAIMRALREALPHLEAIWLTAQPNISILKEAGELLHPSSFKMLSTTKMAEDLAQGSFHFDSRSNYKANRLIQKENARVLSKVLEEVKPDLVFGDESVEVMWVLAKNPAAKRWPLVLLTDAFYPIAAEPPGGSNLMKRWAAYRYRRKYVRSMKSFKESGFEPYLMLYVGSANDVPDIGMGAGLPRLRDFYLQHFRPIGYIVPFDVEAFRKRNRADLKSTLGYDPKKKLIIASVGGIGIGQEFFERIDRAALELSGIAGGGLEIVFVCGPRLQPESVHATSGIVSVRGYVPRLYEHFAAADFAVIKAGLTSAVELAVLGTPFVYVPIPGSVEEEFEVAPRLKRLGVGRQLSLRDLTPANLVSAFRQALNSSRDNPRLQISTDGAEVAAKLILGMLPENTEYHSTGSIPSPTLKAS